MRLPVKKYTSAIGTIALSASLMVTISSSDLLAAECEISGLNIIQAYNRALSNGASFGCYFFSAGTDQRYLRGNGGKIALISFVPLPTMLQCHHKKDRFARGNWNYRMLAFNKSGRWPLNGWKISRYSMSTSHTGKKIPTRSGGIVYQVNGPLNANWDILLKKFWLKKNGASCSNINAVIRSAFGD